MSQAGQHRENLEPRGIQAMGFAQVTRIATASREFVDALLLSVLLLPT